MQANWHMMAWLGLKIMMAWLGHRPLCMPPYRLLFLLSGIAPPYWLEYLQKSLGVHVGLLEAALIDLVHVLAQHLCERGP